MQWQSQVSPLILTVSCCLIHCSAFRTLAYIYKQLTLTVLLHPSVIPVVFLLGSEMKGCNRNDTLKPHSEQRVTQAIEFCLLFVHDDMASYWITVLACLWLLKLWALITSMATLCFVLVPEMSGAQSYSVTSKILQTIMLSSLWTCVSQRWGLRPVLRLGIIL